MFAAGMVLYIILCPSSSPLLQEHYKVFSFSVCLWVRLSVYWNLYIYEYEAGFFITSNCKNQCTDFKSYKASYFCFKLLFYFMDFIKSWENFYPEAEFWPVGEILKPMESKEALPLILLRIYFDLGH